MFRKHLMADYDRTLVSSLCHKLPTPLFVFVTTQTTAPCANTRQGLPLGLLGAPEGLSGAAPTFLGAAPGAAPGRSWRYMWQSYLTKTSLKLGELTMFQSFVMLLEVGSTESS